ncbi:hypothetical protein AB6C51_18000 [Vibrio splendidus]
MSELIIHSRIPTPEGRREDKYNSPLKRKDRLNIESTLYEHTYLLSNGRRVMDVVGIKKALKTGDVGVFTFISNCNVDDVFESGDATLVHASAVFREVKKREQQPRNMTQQAHLKHSSRVQTNILRNGNNHE